MGCMACCSGSRMGSCHIMTGAAIIGTVQVVIIVAMLAGSALMLDRWRFWELLKYDVDWTTTAFPTTTAIPAPPYVYDFVDPEEVQDGWIVEVAFRIKAVPTEFGISLHCSKDNTVPLHFNPRWDTSNFVARNTGSKGVWDTNEETDGGMPFTAGGTYTVRIQVYTDYYEIFINGASFTRYNHRLDYKCIDRVVVDGDLELTPFTVEFYWNYGSSQESFWMESWLEFALAHHVAFCCVWLAAMAPYALTFYFFDPVWVLPNLAMLVISIGGLLVIIAGMMMRLLDPSTRYQTDEIQEAALLFMLVVLWIWWLTNLIFAWLIYRFYKWMCWEQEVERLETAQTQYDKY